MEVAEALELQLRGMGVWLRGLAHASPGGELVELDRVLGAVIPACRERSIVNSVISPGGAGALEAALDPLASAYDEAGVRAWTVWVPEGDEDAAAVLEARGHAFDGAPAAMCLDLDALDAADPGDLDWDAQATGEEVGLINDIAYGHAPGEGLSPAIGSPAPGIETRSYRARVDGAPACVLQVTDVGSDCMVSWVATRPEHRGLGLASRLLHVALAEARGRGARTSTLQASMLGRGVYERIGYRVAFRFGLYERRSPRLGGGRG
jgi:GNAT superfamily N-acetyltransferase